MSEKMTREKLLQFINETALMQSLLYDLDLMPEQLTENSPRWETVNIIAGHMLAALDQNAAPSAAPDAMPEEPAGISAETWADYSRKLRAIAIRLREEIERLRKELADAHGIAQACERRADQAEAEARESERDAERYRALRKQDRMMMPRIIPWDDHIGISAYNSPEAIDAAIDAAQVKESK